MSWSLYVYIGSDFRCLFCCLRQRIVSVKRTWTWVNYLAFRPRQIGIAEAFLQESQTPPGNDVSIANWIVWLSSKTYSSFLSIAPFWKYYLAFDRPPISLLFDHNINVGTSICLSYVQIQVVTHTLSFSARITGTCPPPARWGSLKITHCSFCFKHQFHGLGNHH